MNKRTFKYVLPMLFIGSNVFAQPSSIIEKMDSAIAKVNKEKILGFCKGADNRIEEAYKAENNSLWDQLLREINESSLGLLSGGTSYDINRTHFNLSYDSNSSYYAPSVHAGRDRFNFSLGLAFPLLSKEHPVGLGLTETREVTFTRLYPTKCTSLVRLPYNPITRMPVTAEKALQLEDGELVSYNAPFTISLGIGTGDSTANAGVSYFRTADVDVNIFKMENNHVRVRMIARQGKGLGFSAGVSQKLGNLIRIADIRFNGAHSSAKAELIDYIFNLNDSEARKTYTNLVSPHDLTYFNVEEEAQKIKTALFEGSDSAKTMFVDARAILKEATSNPQNVIRVMGANSDTTSLGNGFSVNFLNSIKLNQSSNYADAKIQRVDENSKVIDDFFMRSIESISRSKFFSLASKDKYQLGTIITDLKTSSPLGLLIQKHSNKQELTDLSKKKWAAYLKYLPMTANEPNVDAKLEKLKQEGGRLLTREMFFIDAQEFFKNAGHFSHQYLKDQIREIFLQSIDRDAMLTSIPAGLDSASESESGNQLIQQHNRYLTYPKVWNQLSRDQKLKELEWIYSYELNSAIPTALLNISNGTLDREQRLLAFNALMQTPLFNEIGINLLTHIVPPERLSNMVVYQVLLQSNNSSIEPLLINYGNALNKQYIVGQNALLTKNFSLDPGSELRTYLRVNGSIKSVDDIQAEAKLGSTK